MLLTCYYDLDSSPTEDWKIYNYRTVSSRKILNYHGIEEVLSTDSSQEIA